MQKAVIYARYSSSAQKEESIERQIEICSDYAKLHDLYVIGSYVDRGKTGRSDNRPDFQRMIYNSNQHQFDVVLVWRYDRFARNMEDHAVYEHMLRKNQVSVISATEPIPEGSHAPIVKGVILGYNESYSAELAAKVTDGMYKAALKGQSFGGCRVLGYRTVDKAWVVDEGEAQIVRMIFDLYHSGKSMSEIVLILNAKNFKNTRGGPFQISSMRRILTNQKYIGILSWKGTDIGARIPPIIDRELFEAVQIQIDKNKKAPARNRAGEEQYLLTAKLYCGHCKGPMSGVSGVSHTDRKYKYYACTARYKHKKCSKQYIPKELLENAVIEVVKHTLLQNNIHELAKAVVKCCRDSQDNGKLLKMNAELREVNRSIENLLSLVEAGRVTDSIATRLETREAEKKELEQAIARENLLHRIPTEDEVEFFFSNYIDGEIESMEYNRYMVDILINSVYLYDNDDGTQKMTVLLNVQNGQETVQIDTLEEGSSIKHMVHLQGLEPWAR